MKRAEFKVFTINEGKKREIIQPALDEYDAYIARVKGEFMKPIYKPKGATAGKSRATRPLTIFGMGGSNEENRLFQRRSFFCAGGD